MGKDPNIIAECRKINQEFEVWQAETVLRNIPVRKVSGRTMRSLLGLMEKKSKPNRALRDAARRFKRGVTTGRLIIRD